jgi:S1-C subfamily serine protease
MQRVLILGATSLVILGLGIPRYQGLQRRLADLEQQSAGVPARELDRQQDMAALATRLSELVDARRAAAERDAGERRLLVADLEQLEAQVVVSTARLTNLDQVGGERHSETYGRLAALESEVHSGWDGLRSAVDAAADLASETRNELDGLVEPSERERWRAMLGPSVKLAGEATVGSGVLLPSHELEDGRYETLVLTAWHVVRDIRADALEIDPLIPVTIYGEDGDLRHEEARLIVHEAQLDVAILCLVCEASAPHGVHLAHPDELHEARIFKSVVAVGCPLGNDPIPTHGEVADTEHHVDGSIYWMINAPAYIGNSGGAVFDAKTHRVLGVFSKIYTHGSLRPTVVPHMGLVTSMDRVYEWLETVDEVSAVVTPRGVELRLTPVAGQ